MKRLLIFALPLCVLLCGIWAASAAAPANFGGTWAMDKQKSEGLQGPLANMDVTLTVTQDAKQLTVETKYSGGDRDMPAQKATYNLDGSETTADLTGFITGKGTYKAKWSADGKSLDLTSTIKGSRNGNEFTRTTTEHWELAEDGKVLKIDRKGEGRNGAFESKLSFNKK